MLRPWRRACCIPKGISRYPRSPVWCLLSPDHHVEGVWEQQKGRDGAQAKPGANSEWLSALAAGSCAGSSSKKAHEREFSPTCGVFRQGRISKRPQTDGGSTRTGPGLT
ncbi:hypothetical protein SKAU_G00058540 [Synaphobranchus kaupii]|uniref:Uncharacterized protein n=1 Tax=Synaphobranchus kaupii TaxID=118154 RepID=A0A9Q1G4E0_SYNKA|nr:hypothetical protein SKAU_G00058540 [Synaphobranchus kaupii]